MKFRQRPLSLQLRQALIASFALGFAPLAFAAPQQTSPDSAQSAPAPSAPARSADTAATLDTVTVTAQSRQQELQDVPITLQVVNDQTIDQLAADDLSDIASFIPGLFVDGDQKTQPGFTLRGIYTDDFGIGTDPAVGVYIDGVYTGRSGGSLLAFNDVERVEVLKGPQGTLFGRNSAAGAISIVSKRPTNELESRARVRIGNYGKRYVDGLLNVPAGDYAAFRFNAVRNESDGWMKDAASGKRYNDEDDFAFRAAFQGHIGDNTTAWLSWDHEKLDAGGAAVVGFVPVPPPGGRPPLSPDPSTYRDPRHLPLFNDDVGNIESREFNGVTLTVDHAFEWGNLTSISAWRGFQTANLRDEDGTNRRNTYVESVNREDETSWYQEFKFSGKTERLDWVAGASYYRQETEQTTGANSFTDTIDSLLVNTGAVPEPGLFLPLDQALQANGIPLSLLGLPWSEFYNNTLESTAVGAFGDVIWHVNDRWNLTFGLRYTRDKKKFTWFNGPREAAELDATLDQLAALGFLDAVGIPRETFNIDVLYRNGLLEGQKIGANKSWDDWSPRFVVDYHFNDRTMWFASLAKGYKAGGFNASAIGSSFDNEDVWNFETGIKTRFPDANVELNASVYTYRYDNRQAIRIVQDAGQGLPSFAVDTSDQEAWGLDADARWRPIAGLTFDANVSFIDSTYKRYLTPEGLNLDGKPTGEPFWSFAGGANYVQSLGDGGDLEFSLRYSYRGKRRCNDDLRAFNLCLSNAAFDPAEAQQRTDARIGWNSADGHWGVAVFANNVFDQRYIVDVRDFTTDALGTPVAVLNAPRMYGLELRASF